MHKDPGLVSAEALIDQGSAETRVKYWIHLDGVREPSLKSGFRSLSRQFYTLFHLTKRLRSGPCRCSRQLVKERVLIGFRVCTIENIFVVVNFLIASSRMIFHFVSIK